VKRIVFLFPGPSLLSFSILERIDVGETNAKTFGPQEAVSAFSILERIDVGETPGLTRPPRAGGKLSVSSNGSTWVKLRGVAFCWQLAVTFSILERIDVGETILAQGKQLNAIYFQYPRTDRRG